MKIPQMRIGLLLVLSWGMLLGFSSCERINNNVDNHEDDLSDIVVVTTELSSMLEFADESSDQTTAKGTIAQFKLQLFSKEAKVIVIDSTYYDGDAVEFLVDFGPTNLPLKPSQKCVDGRLKCVDGRFRGGKLRVILESHYIENTAKSHLLVDDQTGYVFGSENNPLRVDHLEIDIEREFKELLKYTIKKLEIDSRSLELDGSLTLEKIAGANTPGMIGDQYIMKGSGKVIGDQYIMKGSGKVEMGEDDYLWEIGSPLKKKVEPGCGMIPVKGLLNLNIESLNRNVVVDFDPFDNESCDRIVRITNAGKVTDLEIK
ncbi:MAG: hypothetical protein RL712_963 [Bacteroidota bacterium]